MTEFTEKLNASIKKELRRRSDNANLRGFIADDDEIGHLLAKHYDLEHDQNSIVPVVQKKRICESLQDQGSESNQLCLVLVPFSSASLQNVLALVPYLWFATKSNRDTKNSASEKIQSTSAFSKCQSLSTKSIKISAHSTKALFSA